MQLYGHLPELSLFNEFLATVKVESDVAEKWGDGIRRKVSGKIVQTGPYFQQHIGFWLKTTGMNVDGILYHFVNGLIVDWDNYGLRNSWVNLKEDNICLLLGESYFDGTVEEYQKFLAERNKEKQAIFEQMHSLRTGPLTRNDIRLTLGYPKLSHPHLDEPMTGEELQQLFAVDFILESKLTRNVIV